MLEWQAPNNSSVGCRLHVLMNGIPVGFGLKGEEFQNEVPHANFAVCAAERPFTLSAHSYSVCS